MRYLVRRVGRWHEVYLSPSGGLYRGQLSEDQAIREAVELNFMLGVAFNADRERAKLHRLSNQKTLTDILREEV